MGGINSLVSIIIPTYNREHIIGETLQSVLDQTFSHWECIIVDDLSTDNTDQYIQQWTDKDSRFKYYKRHREPKGAPTCRNIGLEYSEGEYVIFFDSDDIMYENLLQTFLQMLREENQIEFYCCDADFFTSEGHLSSTSYIDLEFTIEVYLQNYAFMAPTYFIKKTVFDKIGMWNECLLRLQDVDLFSRLFFYQIPGKRIDKKLLKVRQHQDNITSSWTPNVCQSIIQAHMNVAYLYSDKASLCLKDLIGRRVTAFCISALASGFWRVSVTNFLKGYFLLRTSTRWQRLKFLLKLAVKKPFLKNEASILLYE